MECKSNRIKRNRAIRMLAFTLMVILGVINHAYATVKINYVVSDHLGTPQMLIDQNRNVVWQADYDEFGKATLLVEQVEFNHRLPGQYYDKETELNYNYYRDYDPNLGRYLQSDPIGLAGGINTYSYVMGNPIKNIDMFGLYTCSCIALGGFSGIGYENGVKQFNYSCKCQCMKGDEKIIKVLGGSEDADGKGDYVAYGAITATRGSSPDLRGIVHFYTDTVGFNYFSVNTDPSWYQFEGKGDNAMRSRIDVRMDQECKNCDKK